MPGAFGQKNAISSPIFVIFKDIILDFKWAWMVGAHGWAHVWVCMGAHGCVQYDSVMH